MPELRFKPRTVWHRTIHSFKIQTSLLFKQVSYLYKNDETLISIIIPENLHLLGSLEGQEEHFLFQASLMLLLTLKGAIKEIGNKWHYLRAGA